MLIKTDKLGIPQFSNRNLVDMIYGGHADKVHVVLCDASDDVDRFDAAMEEQGFDKLQKYIPLDVDQKTFDSACQGEWFMPDEYKNINVYEYVLGKAHTPCEQPVQDRIWEELEAFEERNMMDLLRYMIYLVDFMRENSIVWGVGRGSSVSSYVLFLIGVHKIDSLKYDLDWQEFLR